MRILLVPVGSAGDILPLVAVGTVLQQRGHLVTVITRPCSKDSLRCVGLRFVPFGTVEEFAAMTQDPNLWDERRGFEVVGRAGSPAELSRGLSILPGGELRGSDAAERTCDLIEQLPEERTESLGGLRLRLRGFPSGNDVDGVIILTLIGPCLTRLVTTCAKKYHSLKTPKTPFCGIRP